jgi:reverse gyrase
MRKIFPIVIVLLLIAGFYYLATTSGPGDITFRELDRFITSEYNRLKVDYVKMKITREQYITKLEELHKKEQELFKEVKQHKFDNITEYNYWHRGRLKFPSNIKIELDLITKTKKDSL